MKKQIKKWMIRLTATSLLIFSLLLIIVLNPTLSYAHKTRMGNYTVFHNKTLDNQFQQQLDNATMLVQKSELYDAHCKIDVCLNDGSLYPKLIQAFQSPAFGFGFYNKVVIMGNINILENFTEINGYKYNLTQLLAHEIVHCLQYGNLGFWGSNPMAKYPAWKWDGYNEYIARQSADQVDLAKNIERYLSAQAKDKEAWGISFADGTYTSKEYYKWWIAMQYCLTIKKMSYHQVLKDSSSEDDTQQQMMNWYNSQGK